MRSGSTGFVLRSALSVETDFGVFTVFETGVGTEIGTLAEVGVGIWRAEDIGVGGFVGGALDLGRTGSGSYTGALMGRTNSRFTGSGSCIQSFVFNRHYDEILCDCGKRVKYASANYCFLTNAIHR